MKQQAVRILCALVCVWSGSYALAQTEFSADIVANEAHNTHPAKIYMGKEKMRIEPKENDARGQAAVIVDPVAHTAAVLMPAQHMYMEMPQQMAMRRTMNTFHVADPENACTQWLEIEQNKGGSCHKVGSETVNGRSTIKYEGTNAKGETAQVWIDPKLHFPIKWVSSNGQSGGLQNIQEGSQPASLFEIPSDYRKMDMGGMMMGHQPPQ